MTSNDILHFWFTELTPKQHYAKDAALDETICNVWPRAFAQTP